MKSQITKGNMFSEVGLLDRNIDSLLARVRMHVETQNPLDNTSYFLLETAIKLMVDANNNLKAYNRINTGTRPQSEP